MASRSATAAARRAARTYLRSVLRRVESADVERFRALLARAKRKRVTLEEAQALFDRALQGHRARAKARQQAQRARRGQAGVCGRCGGPAPPYRANCEQCTQVAASAVRAKREAIKAARNGAPPNGVTLEASP